MTDTTTRNDLNLYPNPMHLRWRLVGGLFEGVAHEIGDGWQELQDRAHDLAAGEREASAGPVAFDPAAVAERMIDEADFDWRRAVADDVRYSEVNLEIQRRVRAFAITARGNLQSRAESWIDGHEKQICAGFHTERQRIVSEIQQLVPLLESAQSIEDFGHVPAAAPAYAKGVGLLREFEETRIKHLALIQVNGADRSTWWRGLDWVDDYEYAWEQFYLAGGIQVTEGRGSGRLLFESEPVEAPWESANDVARLRSFVNVTVWTPTRRQFDAAKAHVDQAAATARREFADEVRANAGRASNGAPGGMHNTSHIRHTVS